MANKFEAQDPRGFTVVCTEDQWRWHVVDFHPDMEGDEGLVKQAIENPSLGIFRDVDFGDRDVYYLRIRGKDQYIKVIVQFDDENGSLITAFRANVPKAGEKMIWPISTL
jgi:hypothetical protein